MIILWIHKTPEFLASIVLNPPPGLYRPLHRLYLLKNGPYTGVAKIHLSVGGYKWSVDLQSRVSTYRGTKWLREQGRTRNTKRKSDGLQTRAKHQGPTLPRLPESSGPLQGIWKF